MQVSQWSPRAAFSRLVQLPESEIDLAEGALWIAAEDYPDLRPAIYLEKIARMAEELKARIHSEVAPQRIVEKFNRYFFEELHFKGNREEYYDPKNSFLNEVIDRRIGIPITLSVVYIAIGERAGLPVRGVGMPGHFVVKYAPTTAAVEIFIDPFNAQVLDRTGCAKLLEEMFGADFLVKPIFFEPSGKRSILARILNNLKALWMSGGDLRRALSASDRIVLADPHLTSEWRDRGLIEQHLHMDTAALADFNRYLSIRPEPEDAERIRQMRNQLMGRLN